MAEAADATERERAPVVGRTSQNALAKIEIATVNGVYEAIGLLNGGHRSPEPMHTALGTSCCQLPSYMPRGRRRTLTKGRVRRQTYMRLLVSRIGSTPAVDRHRPSYETRSLHQGRGEKRPASLMTTWVVLPKQRNL